MQKWVFWGFPKAFQIEAIQICYSRPPPQVQIRQFYLQNSLFWGLPKGISNRRYSNLSPARPSQLKFSKLFLQNRLFWGLPKGVLNRRYSNISCCITPGSPDILQFYVQNRLFWGFSKGISNRRYSNYCLSPGIPRLEHDLRMFLTIRCMFFLVLFRCFGIPIIFHLRTVFLCLVCPTYEGPKPSQKSIVFYLKIAFHAFGICRTHGGTNQYLLFKTNLV